jgi:hypothetical protein
MVVSCPTLKCNLNSDKAPLELFIGSNANVSLSKFLTHKTNPTLYYSGW